MTNNQKKSATRRFFHSLTQSENRSRYLERFPEDFMFQLSKEDMEFLKSQNVILETGTNMSSQSVTTSDDFLRSQFATLEKVDMRGKHVKFLPYAFTESGIAMLSGVLRSQQAININIQIMRAFVAMRHFITANGKHIFHFGTYA